MIDSLVVTLGLDPTQFKKAAAEVRREHANLGSTVEKAQEAMASAMGTTAEAVRKVGQARKESASSEIAASRELNAAEERHRQSLGATRQEYANLKRQWDRQRQAQDEARQGQDKAHKAEREQVVATQRTTRTEAARTAKELESRGAQAGQFFGQIRNQALSLFALLLGGKGLASFVGSETDKLPGIGRGATNIGVGVRDLAAYRNTIARGGGDADTAQGELLGLATQVQNVKTGRGDPNFTGALSRIGGTLDDDPLALIRKFSAYAEGHKQDVQGVNQLGNMLGLSLGTIGELRGGTFGKDMQESYRQGLPGPDDVKNMTDLQKAWADFTQTAEAAGQKLLSEVAPGLTAVLEAVTKFMQDHPDLVKGAEAAGAAATVAGTAATAYAVAKGAGRLIRGAGGKVAAEAGEAAGAVEGAAAGGAGFLMRIGGPVGAAAYIMRPTPTAGPGMDETHPNIPNLNQGRPDGWWRQFFNFVGRSEGTDKGRDYNESFGFGAYTGGPKNLVGMSLDQIDALQTQMLADPNNKANSSAIGRYQFTRTTLRDLREKYHLSGDLQFDPSMQDQLVKMRLAERGGVNQYNVTHEWASVAGADGKSVYGQRVGATNDELQAILQSRTGDLAMTPSAMAAGNAPPMAAGPTSHETNVTGPITINTQATDAKGIATDFQKQLELYHYTSSANSGLQ